MLKNIFEKVLAGAFLKFGKLDNMDIHLLCKDILSKFNNNYGCFFSSLLNIWRFIKKYSDGTLSLREEFTLDSVIDYEYLLNSGDYYEKNLEKYYHEGITLKEILERICDDDIIKKYFDNLDVNKYYEEKESFLKKQKEELLNNANVLLISDDEEEYNKIIKFGFKKVDWFKSSVVADNYFKENKKTLNKYHILMRGSQTYLNIKYEFEDILKENRNIVRSGYSICHFSDLPDKHFFENFRDELTCNRWQVNSPNYNDILESIVTVSIMKEVLGKIDKKYLNAKPIEITSNPNKLPLPSKKEDIKILCLKGYNDLNCVKSVADKLGLNITFKENNNFDSYINRNMGDYDIIFAHNSCHPEILRYKKEAIEQCKETGRQLALFMTYDSVETYSSDENGEWEFGKYGNELKLKYILVDESLKDDDVKEGSFHVINGENADKNVMMATVESAVNIYNDRLKQINGVGIKDIDFKTADEYDKEYKLLKEKDNERMEKILKPIKDMNNMLSTIDSYLVYKNWLDEEDTNFKINKGKDGLIIIEEIALGKPVARLATIDKNNDTFRDFIFSYEDENHSIKDKKRYGFYTSKHNDELYVPEKPDEYTLKRLNEFEEKINKTLGPLDYKAFNIKLKAERKISEFDDLHKSVLGYLKYREYNLIPEVFSNFKISQSTNGIRIAIMQGERCIAALTFKNNYDGKERTIMIEQINKKGFLSKPQLVGCVVGNNSNISKPTDKQLIIINKVKEIIENQISPANKKASLLYEDSELGNYSTTFGGKKYTKKIY